MRLPQLLVGAWLCLTQLTVPIGSARILLVFPYDMQSQCRLLTPYVDALLDRGHNLTIIHAFPDCQILRRVLSIRVKDRYNSGLDDLGKIKYRKDKIYLVY